mmetsp:Transcript_84669/g.218229  ORF Transcript_84669/g.218229 Transcript_84669/m.218229 type:complete len:274 (-) Transcript_84669:225-1046(-)
MAVLSPAEFCSSDSPSCAASGAAGAAAADIMPPPPKICGTFSFSEARMEVGCSSTPFSSWGAPCPFSRKAATALSSSASRSLAVSAATRAASASASAASSCLRIAVASALAKAMAWSPLARRLTKSFSKCDCLLKTASRRSATWLRTITIISSLRSPSRTTCFARKSLEKLATSIRMTRRTSTMKTAVNTISKNFITRCTPSNEMKADSNIIARAFKPMTKNSACCSFGELPALKPARPALPRKGSSSLSHDCPLEGWETWDAPEEVPTRNCW